jgi:AraC-like DNA-binding protein
MTTKTRIPVEPVSLFVKSILIYENDDPHATEILPFYADGYPGIIFQRTDGGMFVWPQDKKMPEFFLYGQTIHPIELHVTGAYKFVLFQLYPFVIRTFFDLDPRSLNDDCHDLAQTLSDPGAISLWQEKSDPDGWSDVISAFLINIFAQKREKLDQQVRRGIMRIIANDGRETVSSVRSSLAISERAFERRFLAQVGVTPKQFSKMIQFQNALSDLQRTDFARLTDIVYKNGFADQSHFVRVFKAFTGETPSGFRSRLD